MIKEKFSQWIVGLTLVLFSIACSGSAPEHKVKNRFVTLIAENKIQSIDVMAMEISPSGIEGEEYLLRQLEFNEDGNQLKEVVFDSTGLVISTRKTEYRDHQMIERNFDSNNKITEIRTYYMDKEDRDTLIVCTTADNTLLYRSESKYDSIGRKEEALYSENNFTYTKRVNDDKMRQVFEARESDKLVYRVINTYDEKGNLVESYFETFPTVGTKSRDHFKSIYKENNLIDNALYYDIDGKVIKKETYRYKKFDK